MTELSPNNSIDPMTRLPRELAEHVLGYLSFKQLISTSRTSKEWHTFIFRSPSLWRDLDFTFAKRKVRNIFVSRAINSGRSKIKTATLSQMFDVDKACAALARHCALEKLTLINTGLHAPTIVKDLRPLKQLKSLTIGYGTLIHDDHLLQIVKEVAPTLEALRYDSVRPLGPWIEGLVGAKFPNMQIFDLTASVFGIELDLLLEDLHSMMPNLRKLRLHEENRDTPNMHAEMDFQKFKHLTHLDLILEMTTASSIKLPTTITSLAIGVTAPRDKDFLDDVTAFGPLQWDLPLLEELKIGVAEVPFHSIKLLLGDDSSSGETSSARLHTLCAAKSDVKGALTGKFASKDCILRHPRLAELENLSLEGCIDANDDTMFLIAEILPQLRTLNLSETAVTGAGIKAVVKNNCLKKLVLLDCHYLGLDAVSWARGQGVKVEHGMSKQNNGMKKVRW